MSCCWRILIWTLAISVLFNIEVSVSGTGYIYRFRWNYFYYVRYFITATPVHSIIGISTHTVRNTANLFHVIIQCVRLSHRSGRQPQTYVKPEVAITVFELLMMGGVSPETCWAIKKQWNNKLYYTVASCWLFLWDLFHEIWHLCISTAVLHRIVYHWGWIFWRSLFLKVKYVLQETILYSTYIVFHIYYIPHMLYSTYIIFHIYLII
jgi:hypothetical protein